VDSGAAVATLHGEASIGAVICAPFQGDKPDCDDSALQRPLSSAKLAELASQVEPSGRISLTMFEAALESMATEGASTFGPTSFQKYAQATGLTNAKTAPAISVDSLAGMPSELRAARAMVFRLGAAEGEQHTQFALARCVNGWEDYFLMDASVFSSAAAELYIPAVSMKELFAFQLLPALTEASYVNLALASGLLAHALRLDDERSAHVPATGQSTFSFQVRPHSAYPVSWNHRRGQVEIDALFVAQRGGKPHLFLVEAKVSTGLQSLAKHKLVYPLLALRASVPHYLPIVPVYVRAMAAEGGVHFCVCECRWNLDESTEPAIADLRPAHVRRLVLPGYGRAR